ncbi:type II toxin-antitoxin system VapB family antitoxin [uncultured Sphingomonas sp.]|uniref:type II toxin-antitoxin system VapB family antitoxin n=1 Tax=uncultured Sphingomonas sp. TaxID=158754 RepID=UPI0035CBCD57
MRTNIDIDETLMADAMAATGATTKRETVEQALRQVVTANQRRGMLKLRGKINWIGDLDEMRRD